MKCEWCGEPIRSVLAADGLDPLDGYDYVHESGNPYCDWHPTATPETPSEDRQ